MEFQQLDLDSAQSGDIEYKIPGDTTDPIVLSMAPPSNLWHLGPKWDDVWAVEDGFGIRVAILDTGITPHPDLPELLVNKSYISGQSPADRHGHGTHCAGTAVGRNGIGVAPGAGLMNYKVLSDSGSGGSGGIAQAVRDAADDGAHVISMSLGSGSSDSATNNAISYAVAKGCMVVVAAGNSGYNGRNTVGWPGAWKDSITTGAYQSNGKIASFSSGGPSLKWALPGQNIISCGLRNNYVSMSGTSMATPFGAGICALIMGRLLRRGYAISNAIDTTMEILKRYIVDAGSPGFDNSFGHGIFNVDKFADDLIDDRLFLGA